MERSITQQQVLQEIQLIPEDELDAVYAILHYYRLGLEKSQSQAQSVMQYAGCWQDMSDEMFVELTDEMVTRRRQAFAGRPTREAGTD
ncbi:MAG: hypothetical protein JXB07_20545 [Anaerolineae bacterium]|nr:hypothetical protein [Anaerolineae bacterium]